MLDGSGFVVCGSIFNPPIANPDYGYLFKVSEIGDSLWLRKYQPVNWDTTRAIWMNFQQLICTPYNTLAVCGRVSDGSEKIIRAWLLHVDKDGCLVPGCATSVSDLDLINGKAPPFKFFPNPISSDKCYLLSQINEKNCLLQFMDTNGKIIFQRNMQAEKGVQYIVDIPLHLANGLYQLRLATSEYELTEKIIISR
jgi:hypothetical protein